MTVTFDDRIIILKPVVPPLSCGHSLRGARESKVNQGRSCQVSLSLVHYDSVAAVNSASRLASHTNGTTQDNSRLSSARVLVLWQILPKLSILFCNEYQNRYLNEPQKVLC